MTKHDNNNHNQMLLAEKKMEEIEGNMKGWDMLGILHQVSLTCVEPGGLTFGLGKTKSTQ